MIHYLTRHKQTLSGFSVPPDSVLTSDEHDSSYSPPFLPLVAAPTAINHWRVVILSSAWRSKTEHLAPLNSTR